MSTKLLITSDSRIAVSIFSSLLIPGSAIKKQDSRRDASSTSKGMMFAPLLAARAANRSHPHRNIKKMLRDGAISTGGSPQALSMFERILSVVGDNVRRIIEEHLDEFLDELSLPDEEILTLLLTKYRKFRLLGRFYLQKGTAVSLLIENESFKNA